MLDHIYWIGGSPCAGKTTIADRLAARWTWQTYHYDRHEAEHIARRLAQGDASIARFLALNMDERWLRPPDIMARETIESWTVRFPFALEDVRALPVSPPTIAEGPGLFPECIAPLLGETNQAVWLIPTLTLIETIRRRRTNGAAYQTRDPERALRLIAERDYLIAQHVLREARARHLPVFEVSERDSLDDVTEHVARHFEARQSC